MNRTAVPLQVSLLVDSRDGRSCVNCERGHADGWVVEYHHLLEVSKGGRHTLENIETLCLYCHAEAHAGNYWAVEKIEERIVESEGGRTREWLSSRPNHRFSFCKDIYIPRDYRQGKFVRG